jgi:hypothetical protein
MRRIVALALAVAALAARQAEARTLEVGRGAAFSQPSAAARVAQSGDTIRIAPGRYVDCAVLPQNDLTIEGTGPNVVLAEKTCAGKALLVIDGTNVTVRNLTLQHARVPDHNGAGIRAEGGNLTVVATRFLDNENGILTGNNPAATLRVSGSTFIGNGSCEGGCAHGIYAGGIGLLRVETSHFLANRAGHDIKSRAFRTEVTDCDIADGPDGSSSYLIEAPNGGSVVIERNRLEKGLHSQNPGSAIVIGAEGVTRPTAELLFRGNHFVNDVGRPTVFVRNMTTAPAVLTGNVFAGPVQPLVGVGTVR